MDNQTRKKKCTNKKSSKLYPVRYFPRNSGLVGLQNLGNTCYMNAALQALSNCPQLTSYMLENYENIKPGLAKNFALLLYEIWVHSCLSEYSNQSATKVFYDYLTPTSILYGIKNACPNFRASAQQEDAQEFLKFFLDQIHEELKTPVKRDELVRIQGSEDEERTSLNSDLNYREEKDLIILNSTASSSNEEKNVPVQHSNHHHLDQTPDNHHLFQMSENPTNNHLNNHSDTILNGCSDEKTNKHSNQPDQLNPIHVEIKSQTNHLSQSHDVSFDCSIANRNSVNKKCSIISLDDCLINANDQINQITPGLGDVNYSCSNDVEQQNSECKENDLNKSNGNSFDLPIFNNGRSYSSDSTNSNRQDNTLHLTMKNPNEIVKHPSVTESSESNGSIKTCSGNKAKEKTVYQSIISSIFDGEILNSVQCLTCKNVSTIKETFQDLSLPIPNKDDLQQTRQMNKYLKSLENSGYSSSLLETRSSSALKVSNQNRKSSADKKSTKLKNGLSYSRLTSEEESEHSQMNSGSSSLGRRLVKLPFIKQLFILLLYINYFLKAYVLYYLLSIFYWSHTNLWGPTITLNDCLEALFSTDELKDNNMYSCEKCKKLRNGIKYTNLVKSPELLCIHFKRFRNELMFPSKISTYVSFPIRGLVISSLVIDHQFDSNGQTHLENLKQSRNHSHSNQNSPNVSSLVNSPNECHLKLKRKVEVYDLVSVICHRGHYNSGHYITYALNCLDECWYEYDDKTVRKVDESKVMNCEAYVLFYKKRSCQDDLSAPSSSSDTENECVSENEQDQNSLLPSTNRFNVQESNDDKLSFLHSRKSKNLSSNDRPTEVCLTRSAMFRRRKYDKINGEHDRISIIESQDLLSDINL